MLKIVDINTNSSNLEEVEQLKLEFNDRLSPTVKDGTLLILSNFPAAGNIAGLIDYIFFLAITKNVSKNYLSFRMDGRNYNIDNFVFLVKKIEEDIIRVTY